MDLVVWLRAGRCVKGGRGGVDWGYVCVLGGVGWKAAKHRCKTTTAAVANGQTAGPLFPHTHTYTKTSVAQANICENRILAHLLV